MKNTPSNLLDEHLATKEDIYRKSRLLFLAFVFIVVGIASLSIRPYANTEWGHLEAMASLLLMIITTIAVYRFFAKRTYKRKILKYITEVITIWMAYPFGWFVGSEFIGAYFIDDIIGVGILGSLVAIVVGIVLMYYNDQL